MTDSPELQDASLKCKDGTTLTAKVPAFPDHPELVEAEDAYFAVDNPVIGYGTTSLGYHEVAVYEASV
jgi:hypothetical protein